MLASLLSPHSYAPFIAAVVCTGLTYSGFAFLPIGSEVGKVFINLSLAVLAIWARAILGLLLKREKEHVQHNNETLQLALEAAKEGMWEWDLNTDHVQFSPSWLESLGYRQDEIQSHLNSWKPLVHPEDVIKVQEQRITLIKLWKLTNWKGRYANSFSNSPPLFPENPHVIIGIATLFS